MEEEKHLSHLFSLFFAQAEQVCMKAYFTYTNNLNLTINNSIYPAVLFLYYFFTISIDFIYIFSFILILFLF